MKVRVKKMTVLFMFLFFRTLPSVSQIRYFTDVKDLEKAGNGWGGTLINIAIILGGVAAVFALIKVFKGIEKGDQEVQRVAGGWFVAVCIFIVGVWFVRNFVIKH